MALTFATGQTLINSGDSATDYAFYRTSGTGGTGSLVASPDFFVEGTGSVSYRVQANWEAGILYDYYTANGNTVLNMTTTGRHLFIWWNYLNAAFIDTDANFGVYVVATSDAGTSGTPTNYARWTVASGPGGTASIQYPGGWILTVIDLNETPSSVRGSGCTISSIRRLGIGVKSITGTVKTENLYLDAMWYGQANYSVTGDGTTVATWQDFIDHSTTNANGLFNDIGGAVLVSSGIQFGTAAQAATTNFNDSTGKRLIFKRYVYYNNAGSVVDCVDYANLYSVTAVGAASFKTSVQLGTVVGTGDNRQGVLGGGISSADTTAITWKIDFSTDIADLTTVKLYGSSFGGANGGILLNDGSKTSVVSCSFLNCGAVNTGGTNSGAEILNSSIIDPLGTTLNYGMTFSQTPATGTLTHLVKNMNLITSGSPATQYMIHYPATGTYNVAQNGFKYFGDYSSGTLWHGINTGASAAVTIQAVDSTASGSEFSSTAGGSVTVQNSVGLTVTVVDADNNPIVGNGSSTGARVAIYRSSDLATVISPTYTNASGQVTGSFNFAGDTPITVRVRLSSSGSTRYVPISTVGTIISTGYVATITLNEDSIVSA